MPLAAQHPAERRPSAVGDDQPTAAHGVTVREDDAGDALAVPLDVHGPRPVERHGPVLERDLPDPGVQLHPRHRPAVVGQRPARPRQGEDDAESRGAQAAADAVGAYPVAEAETVELGAIARG